MGTRVRYTYGPPSVDKALGALPVVAAFCRRLDIAGIVDRACPVRDVAILTHGQAIEALIANRLTSPTPLVHVEDWARAWAVEEVFGVAPDALQRRPHRPGPRRRRPRAGRHRRLHRRPGGGRLRHRRLPHPLGHDLHQPLRRV